MAKREKGKEKPKIQDFTLHVEFDSKDRPDEVSAYLDNLLSGLPWETRISGHLHTQKQTKS